jgi:hypothetical protein
MQKEEEEGLTEVGVDGEALQGMEAPCARGRPGAALDAAGEQNTATAVGRCYIPVGDASSSTENPQMSR